MDREIEQELRYIGDQLADLNQTMSNIDGTLRDLHGVALARGDRWIELRRRLARFIAP